MKPKILLIALLDLEHNKGDSNHFKRLIDYLNESFEVSTITIGSKKNTYRNKYIKFPKNSTFRQFYWNLIITFHVLRFTLKNNIGFVYARPMGAVILPYLFLKILKIKIAFEINGILIEGYENNKFLYSVLFKSYRFILNKAEFIAASKGYCIYVNKVFKVPNPKLLKLTLGYDVDIVLPSIKKAYSLINIPQKNYITFIGNITEYQGIQYIVNSIVEFRSEFKSNNICMLVIGDGPYKSKIEKQVLENGVDDLVSFIDRVDKTILSCYLSVSKIGLSPFDYKRGLVGSISGLKTYDYLFHKLPILTSKMDDAAEFIESNNYGLVIESFSNKEIKHLIFNMLSQSFQIEAKRHYDINYNFIKTNFSWEKRFSTITMKLKSYLR